MLHTPDPTTQTAPAVEVTDQTDNAPTPAPTASPFPTAQHAVQAQAEQPRVQGPHDNFIFQLLQVVPPYQGEGQGHLISKIHEALGQKNVKRSLRTVQRRIDQLRDQYFDVTQRGQQYIVQLRPGLRGINFQPLTPSESFLLTLAYKQLSSMLPPSLKANLEHVFEQALASLDANPQAGLDREWMNKIYAANSTQPLLPAENKPDVLEQVSHALYRNHYLKVDYTNKAGERRKGEVMPLALVQQGNKMMLVCRCAAWDIEELKLNPHARRPIHWNLMLHRFNSAQSLDNQSFIRPADFDVKEYERRGGFGIGNGQMVRLSFDMKREFALSLLETKLSADQEHQDHGDWITVHATVADTFILNHWLRGFGSGVKNITKVVTGQ